MKKTKQFHIELLGIGLPNRGAELLARATIHKIRTSFPEAKFCTRMSVSKEELKHLGIQTFLPKKRRLRKAITALIRGEKFARESQVRFILDLSGFAYGDFWGSRKAHQRLGKNWKQWNSTKKPLFILPQAFGPFTDSGFLEDLKPALEYATSVYPRDQESANYLKSQLSINTTTCPDITFAFDAHIEAKIESTEYCILIPNSKMLDSQQTSRIDYVASFRNWIQQAKRTNIEPILLCHEGIKDLELCEEMARESSCTVLAPSNALEIKGILKNAAFVVTSRYHGLISSLIYSVPVIAYGWSHKYEEVMKEFELEHMLISNNSKLSHIQTFEQLLDPKSRTETSDKISKHLPAVQQKVERMWDSIIMKISNNLRR